MRIAKVLCFMLAMSAFGAQAIEKTPKFSFTYNAAETAGFLIANQFYEDVTYLPFHFNAHVRLNNSMDLSLGLVYRYENYGDQGELYRTFPDGKMLNAGAIWTNYHEIFLLAGPRFNFQKSMAGFYATIRAGSGIAISPKYFSFSLLAEPELGYTFNFGTPGFTLNLGLGVLLNLPVYETVDFMVPWSKDYVGMSPLGVVVHQAIPVINVGLGFNI